MKSTSPVKKYPDGRIWKRTINLKEINRTRISQIKDVWHKRTKIVNTLGKN